MLVSFQGIDVELAELGEGDQVGVESAATAAVVQNAVAEAGWLVKVDVVELDSTPRVAQDCDHPQGGPLEGAVVGVSEVVAIGVADGLETTGEGAAEVFESQPYFSNGKTILADGSAKAARFVACASFGIVMWRMHAPTTAVEFPFQLWGIPETFRHSDMQ